MSVPTGWSQNGSTATITAATMPTTGPAIFRPSRPITKTDVHVTKAKAIRCPLIEWRPSRSNTDKRAGNNGGWAAVGTSSCGCVTNGAEYPFPSARLVAVRRKYAASVARRGNVTAVTKTSRTARPKRTIRPKIRLNRGEEILSPSVPALVATAPSRTANSMANSEADLVRRSGRRGDSRAHHSKPRAPPAPRWGYAQ